MGKGMGKHLGKDHVMYYSLNKSTDWQTWHKNWFLSTAGRLLAYFQWKKETRKKKSIDF